MANAELVRRMKDFFVRQGAYCEACLRDLESFPPDVESETLDEMLTKHRSHIVGRDALEKELASLRAEWEGAHPAAAEREEVERAARDAAELSRQLAARNAQWKKWADERMVSLTSEIAGLRRGRSDIGRYDSARNTDASFFDEKI